MVVQRQRAVARTGLLKLDDEVGDFGRVLQEHGLEFFVLVGPIELGINTGLVCHIGKASLAPLRSSCKNASGVII